ncbi:MAG: class I SAM-dependent rRNA methyltransferase [Bacteroidales bacterium]|nr:class I SAM-dependent rRNA methyltransferase [Bacteroidales bacterium]
MNDRVRLILQAGKEKSLMRRHPWLFSGAVKRIVGSPQEGDVVDIVAADGTWLAAAHYQPDSIVAKVLSFNDVNIDEAFWRRRLESALAYRERLGLFNADNLQHTNVFRLVNGEGDFLPGLIVDYYNGVVVLQAHSVGMHRLFHVFSELIVSLLQGRLPLHSIFDKSSATLPEREGLTPSQDGYLWGQEPEEWEICEADNKMLINFFEGQKTGFFVDQRENRQLLGSLSAGRRVLNCFGYTGGFSLAALRGGASYVETVDISKKAIALCDRNVALNYGDGAPHRGVVDDVLRYLDEVDNTFDIIVLDPPAFAKNHYALQRGLKGYRKINQRAMEALRPGGMLFTFSCSQAVSVDDFQTMAFTAAANAGREVRVVRRLPHAVDHPVSIFHPEGEYLKGLLLEVGDKMQ